MLKTLVKLQIKLALLPAKVAFKIVKKVLGGADPTRPASSYSSPPPTPPPPPDPPPSPLDLQVDPQQVIDRIKEVDENIMFIDVRQATEVAGGMIEGALHIPTQDLPRRLDEELGDSKDAEIFVYCAAGIRSLDAVMFMREKGFTNVLSLGGGIAHWQADGGDVVVPE